MINTLPLHRNSLGRFILVYLDRVSYNTTASLLCLCRPPEDTRDLRHPHTHTLDVWRSHQHHSCENRATTPTTDTHHLHKTHIICNTVVTHINEGVRDLRQHFSTQTRSSVTVLGVSLRSCTVCAVVAWWRVDTGSGSNLFSLPTCDGTVRPHRPRGPPTIH